MRTTCVFISCSFLAALVIACGSSSSGSNNTSSDGSSGTSAGTLDCNWLSGPNCYKATLMSALARLPDPKANGKMSADGKTCTYDSGQIVTFDSPLTLPLPSNALFNFTVTSGGTQCLKFNQSDSNTLRVTTSAGTFDWASAKGGGAATCPDGTSYSTSGTDALLLLKCDGGTANALAEGIPAASAGSSATTVQFWLGGSGTKPLLPIFNCATQ